MLKNTTTNYGSVTKAFHWITAILIVLMIPLGIYANGLAYDTGEALAFKAQLFSLHKTVGVLIFFVALARILWAFTQPKPAPLHPDRKVEHLLAQTVHWLLYASLVVVPLTGWIHHAATTGFAPIWWPFGQSLPLVPKDDSVAHVFASLHIIFERVLAASLLLHIAGALKHHFFDRDVTLKRMLPGQPETGALPPHPRKSRLPLVMAVGAYGVALAIGAGLGLFDRHDGSSVTPALAAVETGWQVDEGTLAITIKQLGSDVTGSFTDWTAAITFDETPDATGKHGAVDVTISIPSLTLGSVTQQALGGDFFNSEIYPTANFTADILADGENYIADGTLKVRGTSQPLVMPFSLTLDGDRAEMTGNATVNRTKFNIGEAYPDETSVGFTVGIDVSLSATRQE